MRINHNLAALNTYRQLSSNQANGSKSLEKLSSGLRINRAGDDAAGLAISEKMRGQIRGLDQASRNSQDGISMIQTSEGALAETQSILQRMKELATQSSNGTNTASDRGEIQKEMNQLSSEINRIGNTTEFNTQKLLRGTTAPVVETAATKTEITAGVAGVAVGATSTLATNASSVVAVSSSTSVQGNTANATGTVGATSQTTASIKGEKAAASLFNGMTFKTENATASLNTKTITIRQLAGASQADDITETAGNVVISIGTDAASKSTFQGDTRGELANFIKGITGGTGYAGASYELVDPIGEATAEALVGFQDKTAVATAQTYSTGTVAGGVTETRGVNTFTITDTFNEAGDTVNVGDQTFTAKLTGADTSKGEFNINEKHSHSVGATALTTTDLSGGDNAMEFKVAVEGTDYTINATTLQTWTGGTADEFLAFVKDKLSTGGDGTGTKATTEVDISLTSDNKLRLISKVAGDTKTLAVTLTHADAIAAFGTTASYTSVDGAATGATAEDQARSLRVAINANSSLNERFTAAGTATTANDETIIMKENVGEATGTALASASVAGAGENDKLIVTNKAGQNLKEVVIAAAGGDTLSAASDAAGKLTISLATTSAYKNTAAEIQKVVQALGTANGVDFSKYEFTTEGNWDTNTTGVSNLTDTTGTLVGGTQEVQGDYSFDITKAFDVGDKVEIKGQVFTAVTSGAIGSKGEFDISGGSASLQAASIRDAISLNASLKGTYTAGGSGSTISLTEKVSSGTDLKSTDLAVRATGTQGEYNIAAPELLTSGSKFVLDGEEISVSNKLEHVGYETGTAIKEASSVSDQTKAIADAINTNVNLKDKYTASVGTDGSLTLKQTDEHTSDIAPVVSTKGSSEGDFNSTFQVGANSGQSMTIQIGDMRSAALGVTGDGTATTVKASNGFEASYVTTATVTDGTTNKNVEFALDVSTHEKATAAIGILDDAIASVSAQRSQLGSYQNRLEHTINNLGTSSENLTAAESRVRDVDMAKEMMEFTKNNILSQAAQAMMAQANQQPQGVLQLLR